MGDVVDEPRRISLDGDDWRCRSFLGDEWHSARLGERAEPGRGGWLRASVPGSVVADLWRAGQVPDPYRDRNSRFAEWAADRWWAYQTEFELTPLGAEERVELVLEGIDYAGRVFLDGDVLGEHEGMFMPARFEIGERLAGAGRSHLLTALIAPAPHEESQVGDTARVRTHKSRMTYGWDFCPRLVHQGIWQSVWLRRSGPVRIERPFLRAQLAPDRSAAMLLCDMELDARERSAARVRLELRLAGERVASTSSELEIVAGRSPLRLTLELERPRLWWPNGYGEQPLYEALIEVEAGGRLSDRCSLATGLRSLRLADNDDAPVGARPYRLVVNDVPIYVNGWNWVPIDLLYGVPRAAKLEHLLRLARSANVNLLRVWGGGLIESDDFYARCDRLGLLVWQEFIQSSSGSLNAPAEDPDFVAMMAVQAEDIVPRRRNHPSLALWCGGNELTRDGRPLDESAPVLGALADVVRRLDPERPFLPTSPSGPLGSFVDLPAGGVGHDVHGPWEHQGLDRHQSLYTERAALLHSEFGVEGMANLATIEATIAPALRWPPTRDNPAYAHRGAWWINEPLVQAAFGGDIDDLPTLIRASQLLQADGLRYAVEASLRRRWQSSGTLPWQFNEPFPNAWCTSAVDYYGRPKPAYHAVAAAYQPLNVSATFERRTWAGAREFEAEPWLVSALAEGVAGMLVARCLAADGREAGRLEADVECPPLAGSRFAPFTVPCSAIGTDLFLLDLELRGRDGGRLAGTRWLFSRTADLAPLRFLPTVGLEVTRRELRHDCWAVSLRNAGAWLTPALHIEDARPVDGVGWAVVSDDQLSLLPGEERIVEVTFEDVPASERRLRISGWNVAERLLD